MAYSIGVTRICHVAQLIVLVALGVVFILMACSSSDDPPPRVSNPSPSYTRVVIDTVKGSISGAWQAVQSPLEDVGLKRQPIPEKLKQVAEDPYAIPSPMNCSVITSELLTLNILLGPDITFTHIEPFSPSLRDIKMPSWQNKDQYIAQGSNLIQEKAADAVRNQVSILPYRGWIRQLSGADAHARKVAHAYEAGRLRRAFLKGLSRNMGCWYVDG